MSESTARDQAIEAAARKLLDVTEGRAVTFDEGMARAYLRGQLARAAAPAVVGTTPPEPADMWRWEPAVKPLTTVDGEEISAGYEGRWVVTCGRCGVGGQRHGQPPPDADERLTDEEFEQFRAATASCRGPADPPPEHPGVACLLARADLWQDIATRTLSNTSAGEPYDKPARAAAEAWVEAAVEVRAFLAGGEQP